MSNKRLYYIDNLRIFLISLVILLHLNITYGAPGDWYYNESEAGLPEVIFQSMFNITNQAYFMGMFFFISAFFTAASLKRKSTGQFIKDRLVRLGIPLLVFYFFLNPLSNYIHYHFIQKSDLGFIDFLTNPDAWGFGPMWFVETLLLFTFVYLLVRKFNWKVRIPFPGMLPLVTAAMAIGLSQYIIRIWLPTGWSLTGTGLQFPFFVQYILMLIFGVVAYENNWLDAIEFKSAKRWFIFAQLMIWVLLPAVLYVGGKDAGPAVFGGNGTWQSFVFSMWEQVVGMAMIIGLLGIAKKYCNKQGTFAKELSDSAYGVYIIHTPLIIGLAALFVNWDINQLLKFIVLAPVALIACFLLAWIIRKIPGVKRVI